MFNHYSQTRIPNPFQLIPPVASGLGDDEPDETSGRRDEQRGLKPRLLLAEDVFLLSTILAADLREAGYEVLGPYSTVAAAMAASQSESFDAAILDINLRGEFVYPVAEELARRRIPFLFLSGYATINMPERFRTELRIAKPADWTVLLRELQSMLRPKS